MTLCGPSSREQHHRSCIAAWQCAIRRTTARAIGRMGERSAPQRCNVAVACRGVPATARVRARRHGGQKRSIRRMRLCAICATDPVSRPHRPRSALHPPLMLWIDRHPSERPAPAFARAGLRVAKPLDSPRGERAPRCDRVLGADYSGSESPRAAARACARTALRSTVLATSGATPDEAPSA